jgi:hypothetical protein
LVKGCPANSFFPQRNGLAAEISWMKLAFPPAS